MLEAITNALIEIMKSTGFVGIFFITILESLFAPLPSEIILVFAGSYVKSQGGAEGLILMALVAALGNYVGTLPFYGITRFASEKYLDKFINKWGRFLLISRNDVSRVEKFFNSKGKITIFLSKLIPTLRSLIAIPAGLAKTNFLTFTVLSIAGSFLWSLFLGSVGFIAFDRKDEILQFLKPVEGLMIGLIVIVILIYLIKLAINFRKISAESTHQS